MHQIVLSSERIDQRILQKLNDIEEENSKLSLFDKVKLANQKNSTCITVRDVIRNKKKSFDEMLLRSSNQSRIFYSSRRSYEYQNSIS
jgi:hypothetical protein